VFQEDDPSGRLEDPPDLGQGRGQVIDASEHERADDRVDAALFDGQVVSGGSDDVDRHRRAIGPGLEQLAHGRSGLGGDHAVNAR